MSSAEGIQQQVVEIMREQLGLKEEELRVDADFSEDMGLDSLDLVELVMALEENFEIEIPDENSREMHNLQDVINYIEQNLSS